MAGEAVIRARLGASAALALIVASKIYGGRAPQNTVAPFVVWQRVSGNDLHTLEGATDLRSGRFQIDCYGATYDQALEMSAAVRAAVQLHDADMEAYLEADRDLFDEQAPNFFRRAMDFMTMERTN